MLNKEVAVASIINYTLSSPTAHDDEQSLEQQGTAAPINNQAKPTLKEVEILKEARRRTFDPWSQNIFPSCAQMIAAGFFYCNVGDRVICIYCELVCQQWTPNIDDPWEVHKTLSPTCPFVIAILRQQETTPIPMVNKSANIATPNKIITALSQLQSTFGRWNSGNRPSVENFARAGFYWSGVTTIVTCFYCNGSLLKWRANDNPMVEHARWFPHCAYAKQECGEELHRNIQANAREVEGIVFINL